MQIKENQIFNLMDTNGRRNDVINAIQIYISILNDLTHNKKYSWSTVPESLAQFKFYQRAIELSPEVFKTHEPYDELMKEIEKYPELKRAIESDDVNYFRDYSTKYTDIFKKFDKGIEDRARHYTSNLVKLGFADSNRNISEVGELLLNPQNLKKDRLEEILPIDKINLLYLRQLLKLRLFDKDGEKYCSPFNMAVYLLLKNDRMQIDIFLEIIQGLNPFMNIDNIDDFIDNYQIGDVVANLKIDIPDEINKNNLINKDDFFKIFRNQKSKKNIEIYWQFYNLLYNFNMKREEAQLDQLITFIENNKDVLKKAFGLNNKLFSVKRGTRPKVEEIINNDKEIFSNNLNEYLYIIFMRSKQLDIIHEYSDTTKRVFNATGIISFKNGYVELAYKELLACILKKDYLRDNIFGNILQELNPYYEMYEEYEEGIESFFCQDISICKIVGIYNEDVDSIINEIQNQFGKISMNEILELICNKRKQEFINYINQVYPMERVKTILNLFKDRNNDKEIKEIVSPDATVPTIYEYIVGIAWYYFSGKKINLLESYNLTLSADFEPLIHAGGGQGDIVIYQEDKVIMLEATLMNPNAQKRGEWEPVLRHSINLKVEEEMNLSNRDVITFFIADSFDLNTINIWKAIASVPLQSSVYRDKFTNNVIIMPLNNDELSILMDKSSKYSEIVEKIIKLFEAEKVIFDKEWRNKFIKQIV